MSTDSDDTQTISQLLAKTFKAVRIDQRTESGNSPTDSLGRYRITGQLGAGGMGEVFQVHDSDLGRQIAAKVIRGQTDPVMLAKFVREAQITGQLGHPNIVPVHELGLTPDQKIYFTMKQVEGQTLAQMLTDQLNIEGCHPIRTASETSQSEVLTTERCHTSLIAFLHHFLKVCDALAFAHSRGVIHRDLKPSNIMIGQFGEVQVMDWGLARVVGQPDPAQSDCTLDLGGGGIAEMAQRKGTGEPLMTLDGTVAGTPSYMPPEQARGEVDKLDRRSDIYALGAILYEMLTLTPPYVGEDGWAVLDQVVAAKLVPPTQRTPQRKIPWELSAVAERALAASQRDRYESVSELKQEIEAFLQGGVLKAADYSTWQVARKWALRHKPAVVAAALILLTVVAAFIGISGQLRKAQEARLEALARSSEAMAARGQETRERLKAQANERRARASKRDFEQLADVQAMRELQAGAAAMWPRRSGLIGQYRDWLDKARELTGKRSVHEATVARLRQLPQRNPGQKVLLSALAQLVRDIDRLKQHHPRGDTIAGIVARLAFAQRLEQLWKADSAAWETARKSISRLPVYAKLKLQPIRGLVPLGPDAATGLWEFAHRGSGEVPRWDTNSKLRITGDTGLVLVLIPPGSFHMGSHRTQNPNKDPQSLSSERPVRRVTLAAFLLSKYEMTQAQWQRATGWNRSTYHPDRNKKGQPRVRAHNPVTNLGWFECRRTLGQLGLQLPTEAQWEYAGRAGTQTPWHCGDKVADLQGWANIGDESARGRGGATWSLELSLKDGHVIHAPVGSFRPNRWGLFDMLGNVREWCRDPYLRDYSVVPRRGDGLREVVNPEKNSQFFKVARGGSYKRAARSARVAHRWRHSPGWHGDDMGVRPVLNLVDWDPQAK